MASKLRKALGSFKDQTSISLVKVGAGSVGAPDLEIALVKATSHVEAPIDEKYVQEILALTYCSRAYATACVTGLGRRLSKTRNWIVALKALMLAHRLLRDGDPLFEYELKLSASRGMSVLTMSDFRDESHTNGWDFSAFVRAYGLYLDERLDCSIGLLADSRLKRERQPPYNEPKYIVTYSDHRYGSSGQSYLQGDSRRSSDEGKRKSKAVILYMHPEELMEKLPSLQYLMERALACRPAGAAKVNRLVHAALYAVVRDSFLLYQDIRDGLNVLLDAFFDMEQKDCSKAFDVYIRGAKQLNVLASFYSLCKALGLCKSSEYPTVQRITEDLLATMEDFLRNRTSSPTRRMRSMNQANDGRGEEVVDRGVANKKESSVQYIKSSGDNLLDLEEPAIISVEEQENKLALALFSGSAETKVNTTTWETFSSTTAGTGQEVISAPRFSNQQGMSMTAPKVESTGWELALIESRSDLSKPIGKATLAGGFDRLLLDSLYEQGPVHPQGMAAATPNFGSASSLASGRPQYGNNKILALPAPPATTDSNVNYKYEDPFVASLEVPPPPYVQMAELRRKQELLVQEQQQWLQYQGTKGAMQPSNDPFFVTSFQAPSYPAYQNVPPTPSYRPAYRYVNPNTFSYV